MTISGLLFKGFVYYNNEFHYFDLLRNYLPGSDINKIIVFKGTDIKDREIVQCGITQGQEKQFIEKKSSAAIQTSLVTTSCRVLEVATEGDAEFRNLHNAFPAAPDAANQVILAMFNIIEGVYLTTFNIDIVIVHQNLWVLATSDPYTHNANNTGDLFNLVTQFKNYWNTTFSNVHKDVGVYFTGKNPTSNSPESGLVLTAGKGSICADPDNAYVLIRFVTGQNNFGSLTHEIGHTFDGDHGDGIDCSSSTNKSVMCVGTKNQPLYFSSASIATINSHISANESCLLNFNSIDVSGLSLLCNNQTSTYTMTTSLAGNIVWSVNNSNLSITSGQGTTSVTVKAKSSGNGSATLTATLTDFNCNLFGEKTVWVGKPSVIPDNGNSQISLVPNTSKGDSPWPCVYLPSGSNTYYWEVDPDERYRVEGETYFTWQSGMYSASGSYTPNGWGMYMNLNGPINQYSNGYSAVAAENTCGSVNVGSMGWGGCGSYYYSISPNPTTDELTISFTKSNGNASEKSDVSGTLPEQANVPVRVEIYNHAQTRLISVKAQVTDGDIRINTSSLKPGSYVVHVQINGEIDKKHLIIE